MPKPIVEIKSPKIIAYDYLFNYFGADKYKEKIITGACVQVAIHVYKNGEEVKFTEEPVANGRFLNEIYQVSFDKEMVYTINKNLHMDNLFRLMFDWDKIEYTVEGFSLDYLCGYGFPNKELEKELPEDFKNMPCSEPIEVSKEDFEMFLKTHKKDFDISDNKNAQVPSVSFI